MRVTEVAAERISHEAIDAPGTLGTYGTQAP
jgi:hypothetical protein